jgi:hypothetical protein
MLFNWINREHSITSFTDIIINEPMWSDTARPLRTILQSPLSEVILQIPFKDEMIIRM